MLHAKRRQSVATRWPRVALAVAALGAIAAFGPGGGARAGEATRATYQLDPHDSQLVVHLFKAGVASKFSHEHLIRAVRPGGRLTMVSGRPRTAKLEIEVDARQLEVDDPGLRRRYHLKPLDASDRAKVRKEMQSKEQLYTAAHPTIRFASKRIVPLGDNSFLIAGVLQIRGVERSVKLKASAKVEGDRFHAQARLRFKQSDFGYKPYEALGGLVKVADEAVMDIRLEAKRVRPSKEA